MLDISQLTLLPERKKGRGQAGLFSLMQLQGIVKGIIEEVYDNFSRTTPFTTSEKVAFIVEGERVG